MDNKQFKTLVRIALFAMLVCVVLVCAAAMNQNVWYVIPSLPIFIGYCWWMVKQIKEIEEGDKYDNFNNPGWGI